MTVYFSSQSGKIDALEKQLAAAGQLQRLESHKMLLGGSPQRMSRSQGAAAVIELGAGL